MKRKVLYFILSLIFIISVFFMILYGQKTFFVNKEIETLGETYSYHFVLIPEEEDNDYWRLIEKGARDAAADHGVYLEYVGPKRASMNEHVRIFDKEIAGSVDGILIQGLSNKEFTPLINKAIEKGTSIVTVDTDLPESRRQGYVGTDNYMAGYMAGKALIEDTKGEQIVGIIIGRKDALHQQLRVSGFRDAVKDEQRIKIVGIKESRISKAGAVQATYDLLKENANINAYFGTSALDGLGIAQVIRTMRPNTDPYVVTFDSLPETMELLKTGAVDTVIMQYPYEMGYQAVTMLVELKKGKHPTPIHYIGVKVIRKGDLQELGN